MSQTDNTKNTQKMDAQQKPQLSSEQIKQLMEMMQKQKPASKYQQYMQKFMGYAMKYAQEFTIFMDKFIKYVINKSDIDKNNVMNTARGPIMFGAYVIFIFVILGGGWAVIAPLDSAERAIGTLIPSSKRKLVQPPQTGIVKTIYVSLGDQVKAGDRIIELDEVQAKAQYEISLNEYITLLAMESRLIAERDDLPEIKFDDFLLERKDDPHVEGVIKSETLLFNSREEGYNKLIESLKQRHLQYEKQLEGFQAKKTALVKRKAVNKEMLRSYRDLYSKGHLQKAKLLEMETQDSAGDSDLSALESEIARTMQQIAGDEAEMLKIKSQYLSDILKELSHTQHQKNKALEQYTASKDALDKVILRSPVDGTIIEMHANTVGGVIGTASPVAEILPANDTLILEARIAHNNIASVHVGLKAKIRFSAFKSRTTPVFNGTVVSLSPDTVQDQRGGQPQGPDGGAAYVAKIEIDMDDFNRVAKKNKLVLRPGMQAEVNIVTGTRTLFRYLLDPVTDTMFNAFKEK